MINLISDIFFKFCLQTLLTTLVLGSDSNTITNSIKQKKNVIQENSLLVFTKQCVPI